jgi:Cellulase (glycosyl hydrolase family 5)
MKDQMNVAKPIDVRVNAEKVIHTMRGGIGASWHAMSKELPLENDKYDYPVRHTNPRGSAYGANPPVSEKKMWDRLYEHAAWLGLNFIRVELCLRMYEPQREVFDWSNEEMLALYKILDWCESNRVDVFLQQMWSHVEWNAYPGVHPLLSAPRSLDDFAAGITELLRHLLRKKKYTCIKYFSITNEPPGGTWGYWWSHGHGSGTITPALKKVRESLNMAGIELLLSGPDWTDLPPLNPGHIDFDESIGAYDIHSYSGIGARGEEIIRNWVEWAHSRRKPFFLTEFGNMNLGWGSDNSGPKSFDAALSNASDIISCLNLCVDGMIRWSFVNRGDLDGQWQLIQTWDREKKTYLREIKPEPAAYFGFAIMSRYVGKYADVVQAPAEGITPEMRTAAVLNRTGELSIYFLNNGRTSRRVSVEINGHDPRRRMYLYQVSAKHVSDGDFSLDPMTASPEAMDRRSVSLPPKSISVLTNYYLTAKDPGIIQ